MTTSPLTCGFILHPLDSRHRMRVLGFCADHFLGEAARAVKPRQETTLEQHLDELGAAAPPIYVGTIRDVISLTGGRTEALVGGLTLMPRQFVSMPEDVLVDRLVAAVEMLAARGAKIIGLAAYTAAMGLGYRASPRVSAGMTSGNSLTAYISVVGIERALKARGRSLDEVTVAVVGATGSVGHGVTEYLARKSACKLVLLGRHEGRLARVAKSLGADPSRLRVATDVEHALADADAVVSATSHGVPFIDARWFRQDAVVCDTGRPSDVINSTIPHRPDVFYFDGGVVEWPGNPKPDFPPAILPEHGFRYACLAETAVLALSGISEHYALGQVQAQNMEVVAELAGRHGFRIGDLRWRDQIVLRT